MAKQKNFHTFEQWHEFDIRERFSITPNPDSEALGLWTAVHGEINPAWLSFVESLRTELLDFYNSWNEQELFGKFIAPIFNTVGWRTSHTNLFHNRPLRAEIKGYKVHGMVDGMVASGSYEPIKPYFFLHEYKRMKQAEADPLGQLLIAMLAARELNRDGKPLYGCYIIGRYWTFVLLEGDTYAQTQGYDATDKEELKTIWLILDKTKQIIIRRVAEELQNNC
jgi:hypothetical protein